MKRPLGYSDHLIPAGEERSMFQPFVDGVEDDEFMDEEMCSGGPRGAKKRRLSADQVRALEKNFEVDNKLEPERKVRLAQELGLQPRQVAVWFQNRRARWKTKQLEHDYAALKASYDQLRLDCDALRRDKESLLAEIKELRAKLADDGSLSFCLGKEDPVASDAEQKATAPQEPPALICKDGSSDSDSSAVLNDAILNDDDSPRGLSSSASAPNILSVAAIGYGTFSSFPASPSPLLNLDFRTLKPIGGLNHQNHAMKMEELLGVVEPCSGFFSDDQTASPNWFY